MDAVAAEAAGTPPQGKIAERRHLLRDAVFVGSRRLTGGRAQADTKTETDADSDTDIDTDGYGEEKGREETRQ